MISQAANIISKNWMATRHLVLEKQSKARAEEAAALAAAAAALALSDPMEEEEEAAIAKLKGIAALGHDAGLAGREW